MEKIRLKRKTLYRSKKKYVNRKSQKCERCGTPVYEGGGAFCRSCVIKLRNKGYCGCPVCGAVVTLRKKAAICTGGVCHYCGERWADRDSFRTRDFAARPTGQTEMGYSRSHGGFIER